LVKLDTLASFGSFPNSKCSFEQAKDAFYGSLKAVFGRIGGVASEKVVLELLLSKCLPILPYGVMGVEACPLNKSAINYFDFIINRFLMKLRMTNNRYCYQMLDVLQCALAELFDTRTFY
jgi:hypothetical protein